MYPLTTINKKPSREVLFTLLKVFPETVIKSSFYERPVTNF